MCIKVGKWNKSILWYGKKKHQNIWIPFVSVPLFHSVYILMEPQTMPMRHSSHISRKKKSKFDCRNCSLNHIFHPKVSRYSAIYTQFSDFFFHFPKKSLYTFLQRVPGSSVDNIQFIFEVGDLKKLFSLRNEENALSWPHLCVETFALNSRIFRLLYSSPSHKFKLIQVVGEVGVRGGAVGCRIALQVGRSRVRFPLMSLVFFID